MGEVAAAVGVVATLVYLARQIRFGAEAQRQATQQAVMTEIRAGISLLIADEHLAESYAEFREMGDVAKSRRAQFELWVSNQFRIYEDIHTSYRGGFIGEEFWRSRRKFMRDFYLSTPLVRRWWVRLDSRFFSAGFQAMVNELLEVSPLRSGGYELDRTSSDSTSPELEVVSSLTSKQGPATAGRTGR